MKVFPTNFLYMVLLKFFCKKDRKKDIHNTPLPDPCGPVGQEVGKELTKEANKEVAPVLVSGFSGCSSCQKREPYVKLTPEQKTIVAKYAAEHGMVGAVRNFSEKFD